MLRIGITGGIGSGKSTVCRLFAERGIPVYNSDVEAKRLMCEDAQLRQALIDTFGVQTFCKGQLNRTYLAKVVFGNVAQLQRLNALVHPRVREDFLRWTADHERCAPYVVLECAILYEAGMESCVDRVVAVVAPKELRYLRVSARDGATAEQISQRMAAQLSDEELMQRADYTLVNIHHEDLDADVAACDHRFRQQQ